MQHGDKTDTGEAPCASPPAGKRAACLAALLSILEGGAEKEVMRGQWDKTNGEKGQPCSASTPAACINLRALHCFAF